MMRTSTGKDESAAGWTTDLLTRSIGLVAIGIAVAAGSWLRHLFRYGYPADPTIGEYALALVTFVAASLGCGLLALGRHAHDRIEGAERWRRAADDQPSAPIKR